MELNNFFTELKNVIIEQVKKNSSTLRIFQVTDVSSKDNSERVDTFSANIKDPNSSIQYNNVPMIGINLGNLKGIISYPNKNDFVVVGWLDNEPVIIGTIFDFFSQSIDNIPLIKQNEMIIVSKEAGQYIYMNSDGDIIMKTPSGGKFKIKNDGSFKLFTKDNYGIEGTKTGDINIYTGNAVIISGTGGEKVPKTYSTPGIW